MLNEDEPVDPPLTLVTLPHGLLPGLIGLFGVVATRVTVVELQNRGAAHVLRARTRSTSRCFDDVAVWERAPIPRGVPVREFCEQ